MLRTLKVGFIFEVGFGIVFVAYHVFLYYKNYHYHFYINHFFVLCNPRPLRPNTGSGYEVKHVKTRLGMK